MISSSEQKKKRPRAFLFLLQHAGGGQSRPPLLPVIPSQSADWRGNPSPQKRKTDCRVATLLAMTARRCRADGTPSPTGGAMWASSPTERRRGVPYRRRSQDMLATARPPMRTVTAPSFSYRTLRISDGRDMCSPCRNTFSSPGFTSPRR